MEEDADEDPQLTESPRLRKSHGNSDQGNPSSNANSVQRSTQRNTTWNHTFKLTVPKQSLVVSYVKRGSSGRSDLQRHENPHLEVKQHRCNNCGNNFARSDILREYHERHCQMVSPMV